MLDASVAVEVLLRSELGIGITPTIASADLIAPELIDIEVMSVLRRMVLAKALAPQRATEALQDLIAWDIQRFQHKFLLATACRWYANLSAYDAVYVALAEKYKATLLTADGPLANAKLSTVVIRNVRQPTIRSTYGF